MTAKRGGRDLHAVVTAAMNGTSAPRSRAEAAGFDVLKGLATEFVGGESFLASKLRELVAGLMDRNDALRRDLKPETWQALWPTLNTLTHAREQFIHDRVEAEVEAKRQAALEVEEPVPVADGPGILRAGADGPTPEGEQP